jgi:hypothetical protein
MHARGPRRLKINLWYTAAAECELDIIFDGHDPVFAT